LPCQVPQYSKLVTANQKFCPKIRRKNFAMIIEAKNVIKQLFCAGLMAVR